MAEAENSLLVHGTAIALDGRAVLVRGPSGAGKSDLVLRCLDHMPGGLIACAAMLVADDQVCVTQRAGRLIVSPPPTIAGLLEVRGIGILSLPHVAEAELALVADIAVPEQIERLPEPIAPFECFGIRVERRMIAAREASAQLKLLLMLQASMRGSKACPACAPLGKSHSSE